MIPLIWKNILKNYLTIFFLSITLFASVLVLFRVYEIARFATLGGGFFNILLFTILQFPLIMPLSIPISCLIATFIIVQKMCNTSEMTSLRSFGFSIINIYKPILFLSIFACSINFYLIFTIMPTIKEACNNLITKVTHENPLALIENGRIFKLQNGFLQMKMMKKSKKIEDLFFAFKNKASNRIALIMADQLAASNESIKGKNIDTLFYEKKEEKQPILIIEHFQSMNQPSYLIPKLLFKSTKNKIVIQKLSLSPLIKAFNDPNLSIKKRKMAKFELIRRIYLSTAPFILTLIGLAYAIDIGRRSSKRFKCTLFALVSSYFLTYLLSKSLKHQYELALAWYLIVLSIIIFMSLRHISMIEKGHEKCI